MVALKYKYLTAILFSYCISTAQNDLHITSLNGTPFTIRHCDSLINSTPAVHVVYYNVLTDTLLLDIYTSDRKASSTVYLLDKGKKTNDKEFSYQLIIEKEKMRLLFSGMYEKAKYQLRVAEPSVRAQHEKIRESGLMDFVTFRNGKTYFSNNIPEKGCEKPMPEEYMNYSRYLFSKEKREEEKYRIIDDLLRNNCVSVTQLKYFLEQSKYELDRIKLVKTHVGHVVDKEHYESLRSAFQFTNSFNQVEESFRNSR